ncbi:hypothetical protein [Rhizobium hidalgonense]|uniref:hypothetical protein n=1 Tax=Rhizobium hidalgonense TaxID=1538159 RepID=UPI0028714B7D|nr:hypothetical protein [Rhizobium hidalgonense]MDR9812127.1 hypothetical protein [Rhizobium hidalgonense]
MKQGDIRSLTLPSNVARLDAAAIAIEHGALVWPVEPSGNHYEPVTSYAGAGRSGWALATRDLKKVAEMLEAHPGATLGVRVPTPHGFDRYFAFKDNLFLEIPGTVYRVGR